MKRLTVILLLTTALFAGCHGGYTVHPGSLSRADSISYDALLTAQATIDAAKASHLSPAGKSALNEAVRVYNIARASWLTYRHGASPDALAKLNADMTRLIQAITTLMGAR